MDLLIPLLQTVGSAVLTGLVLVGLAPTKLGEKFLSFHLERKLAVMRHEHDNQIEELRALLTRGSHVHERQIETLTTLDRYLREALGYLQAMTRTVGFRGEVSTAEYRRLFRESVSSAREAFAVGLLLIPQELAEQCDRFFASVFKGSTYNGSASDPDLPDAHARAGFWREGQNVAYEELPEILKQIERAARELIHPIKPKERV